MILDENTSGPRVLVVEDEALIALMLEDVLEEIGCRVVGVAGTLEAGMSLAREQPLDMALLDVNLGGEPIGPVIGILTARRIPFLLLSGYDVSDLDDAYAGLPLLRKPVGPVQLRRALAGLLPCLQA